MTQICLALLVLDLQRTVKKITFMELKKRRKKTNSIISVQEKSKVTFCWCRFMKKGTYV